MEVAGNNILKLHNHTFTSRPRRIRKRLPGAPEAADVRGHPPAPTSHFSPFPRPQRHGRWIVAPRRLGRRHGVLPRKTEGFETARPPHQVLDLEAFTWSFAKLVEERSGRAGCARRGDELDHCQRCRGVGGRENSEGRFVRQEPVGLFGGSEHNGSVQWPQRGQAGGRGQHEQYPDDHHGVRAERGSGQVPQGE